MSRTKKDQPETESGNGEITKERTMHVALPAYLADAARTYATAKHIPLATVRGVIEAAVLANLPAEPTVAEWIRDKVVATL
jgi:hypothetical protein